MIRLETFEDLRDLPPEWRALFAEGGDRSFFLSLPWFENFADTVICSDGRLRVYGAFDEADPGRPLGALVMRYQPRSWFAPHKLLGAGNYYTSLFAPVVRADAPDVRGVLAVLARGVLADRVRWDIVDIHPIGQDSVLYGALIQTFKDAGAMVRPYFCFGNWFMRVGGRSAAEYLNGLPSALKNTLKRKRKQLESTGRCRVDIVIDQTGLDTALAAYEKVYLASWKVPEPYPAFIPGLVRMAAAEGWLRMGVLYIDDEPAAAQIWIVKDGTAAIYKLAYDERFSKYSAGSLLTVRLMERVIDVDKVDEVDYLTGDDAYKKDWMSDRRERWGIVAYKYYSFYGLLGAVRHVAAAGAKSIGRALGRVFRNSKGPARA